MPVTVTFCCMQFWITRTKNVCEFEGTRELVTRENQVPLSCTVPTFSHSYIHNLIYAVIILNTYVTGSAKINHVSANYIELYFCQYLQL